MRKTISIPDSPARMELTHVTVLYENEPILEDLSFVVPHGAQVAVVGPNGAGKSTLFKALVGLIPIHEGEIFIHGNPLGHHRDCVAYIPQREEVDWRYPINVEDYMKKQFFIIMLFLMLTTMAFTLGNPSTMYLESGNSFSDRNPVQFDNVHYAEPSATPPVECPSGRIRPRRAARC